MLILWQVHARAGPARCGFHQGCPSRLMEHNPRGSGDARPASDIKCLLCMFLLFHHLNFKHYLHAIQMTNLFVPKSSHIAHHRFYHPNCALSVTASHVPIEHAQHLCPIMPLPPKSAGQSRHQLLGGRMRSPHVCGDGDACVELHGTVSLHS